MNKPCPQCGGKVKSGNAFCSLECSFQSKRKEVTELRKENSILKQRIADQNILWENLIGDMAESISSPAHIRFWANKLAAKYNLSNENKMLCWLTTVAGYIETYNNARN